MRPRIPGPWGHVWCPSVRWPSPADDAGAEPPGEVAVLSLTEPAMALSAIPTGLPATAEHVRADPAVSPLAGLDLFLGRASSRGRRGGDRRIFGHWKPLLRRTTRSPSGPAA